MADLHVGICGPRKTTPHRTATDQSPLRD